MSTGDNASCWRLSIDNMRGHMPWVLVWVPFTSLVEADCVIQEKHIGNSLLLSSQIFRTATVGVHVCCRQHTCLNPCSRCTFDVMSNHLACCLSKKFSCSMNAIVLVVSSWLSTYWSFVTSYPLTFCGCSASPSVRCAAQTLAQTLQPASGTDLSKDPYVQCSCAAPPRACRNGCVRACIRLLTHYVHTCTSFPLLSLSDTHIHMQTLFHFQTGRDAFAW